MKGSIVTTLLVPPSMPPQERFHQREWSRAEFYQMAGIGFFEGQRAELLEGQIVVQSPLNWPHASTVTRVYRILQSIFEPEYWVRVQLPLVLGLKSDPEPDVSVVPGRFEDYSAHPTHAASVVEVSDSSIYLDREIKSSIYAAARITEYWIVDLPNRRMIVHRQPQPDLLQVYGTGYADIRILDVGSSIHPLAKPQVEIRVADLLS